MAVTFLQDFVATPVGHMRVVVDEQDRLRALDWEDHAPRMHRLLRRHYGEDVSVRQGSAPRGLRQALQAYLDGNLQALAAIEVQTAGTPFQRAVWAQLRLIPAGTTITYGALAVRIGNPQAVRAVGLANGANPVGVVVPCHRVIGADGSLTGFGGGLPRKRWLLAHEGAVFGGQRSLIVA